MKRFLKKRLLTIPMLVILLAALMGITALAAGLPALLSQTVTQEISEPVPPPTPSSVTGDGNISLPSVLTGGYFPEADYGTVTVVVGTGDAGSWLHVDIIDPDGVYSAPPSTAMLGVNLVSVVGDNPMNVELTVSTNTASWLNFIDSIQLTEEGTYIFTQWIAGVAGMNAGSASVTVDITLNNTP